MISGDIVLPLKGLVRYNPWQGTVVMLFITVPP